MRPMGRPKGTGTIVPIKDSPGGSKRWRVAVTMADGRRVWRTAHSQREAERIRLALVEARELDLDPTRWTLAAYLRAWIAGLEGARNQRVRPKTLDHYRIVTEGHIIPALGRFKLSAVTTRRIQEWVNADPGAPRSVQNHHAVLHRALNVAVKQRLLPWNPAASVELPRADPDTGDPLTLDEARALMAATATDRLGPLWRLALVTGMRQGELLGLAWDDVGEGTVTVHAQLQRTIDPAERAAAAADGRKPRGKWGLAQPKAGRRIETIAIDPATAAMLDAHRRRMAAERTPAWRYHGLVFVTERGTPWHAKDILAAFHDACKRAGIRQRRFHDLRHSNATLLAAAGTPEDIRQSRLGHNTAHMARHYAQASEEQDRVAADLLGAALSG